MSLQLMCTPIRRRAKIDKTAPKLRWIASSDKILTSQVATTKEKEENDPMFKSMAARTTDHNGRIMVVNRKEKKLPKLPSSNIVGVSDGETIKYVPPTDTIASKLN